MGFSSDRKIKAQTFRGKFRSIFRENICASEKTFRANFVLQTCHVQSGSGNKDSEGRDSEGRENHTLGLSPKSGIPKTGIPKAGIPKAVIPKLGIPKTGRFKAP